MCYKIIFCLVDINFDDFFSIVLSRQHEAIRLNWNLAAQTLENHFSQHIRPINVWNSLLSDTVDLIDTLWSFKRTIKPVYFSSLLKCLNLKSYLRAYCLYVGITRSSPRRWPSRLELRCVRPSVRPYVHKKFSDFHVIGCVVRPRPHMRISVTSTRSKVKVKVTELPNLRKVHFSRSISFAIFAWSSKLMVGGHSMGPGLRLVGARFLNFHLGKLSREFKLRPISIFDEIQMAIFR